MNELGSNSVDVLVADDEADIRAVLQDGLPAYGITVRTVGTGRDAFLESLRLRPAAVLMDVRMPDLSGLDAIGLFKIIEPLRNVPVLMLTALTSREDVIIAMRGGSRDYISKPFDLKQTAAHIRLVLSHPLPAASPIFRFPTYTASSDGRGIRLKLEGEISPPAVEDLAALVRSLSPIQPVRMVLDFEKVSGIADGLLSALTTIRETAKKSGGEIFICQLDPQKYKPTIVGTLRRIFEVEAAMVNEENPAASKPLEFSDSDKQILAEVSDGMSGFLRFQIRPAEGHAVLEFFGELTAAPRDKVTEAFAILIDRGAPVVVNLDGVTTTDDGGMANLIAAALEFKQATGENLAFSAENSAIRKSFTAARGNRVAGIHEDERDALAAIRPLAVKID